ncbi:ABC transporter substrate-binding protein [Actinophytocola sp.]|uniref:ABC transporter substrate-binding protein n=1 Tax=Actinophytocola sp. TaxID=1872138 RepID=UPI002D7EA4A6|nr:ABC transporter substrate-binding protein [Actinophytocola sp.]HET9141152.1 ABC transporter substrate-binding protein [Actinophytocola sp.]
MSALKVRLLVIAVVLAGSACTDTATPASEPGTYVVGVREPASLLPARLTDLTGQLIAGALWTPLTTHDPETHEVKPLAALSVTSPDQVVWTIKLRPGVRFHDGSAVTARSYTGAWQAAIAERWPGASVLTDVMGAKDMRGVDDLTIELVLARPFTQLPLVLSSLALLPLPDSVLASRDWAGFGAKPIGTGPYRLDGQWRDGVRLVRFEGYQGYARGNAREIVVRLVNDPGSQYEQVRAGTLDLASAVPGSRHDAMRTDFGNRHVVVPLPEATYLRFPLSDARFRDPAVRHAVALAVDRAALEAGPLDRQVDPARSLLPPSVALPQRSAVCRPCNHDAAAAKSLLGQVEGFAGPVNVYHDAAQQPWVGALVAQLRDALGLDVVAKPLGEGQDPDGLVVVSRPLFTPSPREPMVGIPGYAPAGFAELLAAADAATELAERDQLYRVAENQLLRDLPLVPLWSRHAHAVWSERIRVGPFDPVRILDLGAVDVAG